MTQIILKERAAHLASYTFFTRNIDQYKNTSFSQLWHSPFFTETLITSYIRPVNIPKFLRTAFL